MPKVYVFVYHLKPTIACSEFGKVGGAHVDIWVHDSSRDSAETKAKSHLFDYGWQILEVERELVIDDEQIRDYREDAQANYYQAKIHGISAFFCAYPIQDRDDDVVEIYSLGDPPNSSKQKH
ncbi:MAG: hypothetical protein ACW7DN_17250 [Paraglaciecola chathamensis]